MFIKIMRKTINTYDANPYLLLTSSILLPSGKLIFNNLKEITLSKFGIVA